MIFLSIEIGKRNGHTPSRPGEPCFPCVQRSVICRHGSQGNPCDDLLQPYLSRHLTRARSSCASTVSTGQKQEGLVMGLSVAHLREPGGHDSVPGVATMRANLRTAIQDEARSAIEQLGPTRILVWGAGELGRWLTLELVEKGVDFVDTNPTKIGTSIAD